MLPPHLSLSFPELGVILAALWQVNILPAWKSSSQHNCFGLWSPLYQGLPCALFINQGEQCSPALQEGLGRLGCTELALAGLGFCPPSMVGECWVLGPRGGADVWALGLVESPSLSSRSPPFPSAGPCFSGLLGDNLISPRLLSST